MLSESSAQELVKTYGAEVNEGRSIRDLITSDHSLSSRLGSVDIVEGKVSDSVYGGNLTTSDGIPVRLMYRTGRISTHDVKRGVIPFKEQVLGANHAYMLGVVEPYIGTSQFDIPGLEPTSTVIASENLKMVDLENVIRQYMAVTDTSTSLYMAWEKANNASEAEFSYAGRDFVTADLRPNCRLEELLFSPSTKSAEHDETVSLPYLVENGVCTQEELDGIVETSTGAFGEAAKVARAAGMELVDTKIEHGRSRRTGGIVSGDEVFTFDSSRYWPLAPNGNILMRAGAPVSYSKQFARDMDKGADGQFTSEQAAQIAVRYIMGLQHLTGKEFVPDLRSREQRIIESTHQILDELGI